MPKQGVKRKQWDKEAMVRAVQAVKNKEMGYLKASQVFQVPKGTIERYVRDARSVQELVSTSLGRKPVLTCEMEKMLVEYCIQMEKRYYGLRRQDVKRMAFQLAIRNGLRHPFSQSTGSAGKKWLNGFLARHRELSVRTPQAISAARVKGFNAESVKQFFNIYEKELENINYSPHRLFNVDETGITVVQHKQSKVVGLKGKKQVCAITSLERGKLITVVTCMNAAGTYVPPLIIFPRKNMSEHLMEGAPVGSIWACDPSGWIQTHIFTQWFAHFINFTKPTKDYPVLLVLDGHYSHTRNIELIDMARQNHVSVVCLPPHATHKMQPLDVCFMAPLKTYYAQEIQTFLRNNPGRSVTNNNISSLFGKAYNRTASMDTSINAFRKTGLFPCNRNVYKDVDFTENEVNSRMESEVNEIINNDATVAPNLLPSAKPLLVSPQDIQPVPSTSGTYNSGRRKGSASLITSTPYKTNLEVTIAKKNKQATVVQKQLNIKKPKVKTSKKKIPVSSSSESEESEIEYNESSEEDYNDAECQFCRGRYSEDTHGEKWAQCIVCFRWTHEECGEVSDNAFTCPLCEKKPKGKEGSYLIKAFRKNNFLK